MRRGVGIIALALATVSCGVSGSSETTTAPSATPPPPPPSATEPVAEGSYESVEAMRRDVESTFYLCTAPMKIHDPPLDDDALAQADCSSDVTFLIYAPNNVESNAAALQDKANGTSVLIVGNNWIINCSSDETACKRIQVVTGGELIIGAP